MERQPQCKGPGLAACQAWLVLSVRTSKQAQVIKKEEVKRLETFVVITGGTGI